MANTYITHSNASFGKEKKTITALIKLKFKPGWRLTWSIKNKDFAEYKDGLLFKLLSVQ